MSRALVFCFSLSLLVGLASCATPGRSPRPEFDPVELRMALDAAAEGVTSLRARTKLRVDSPDLDYNRPQRIAVARPGKLRIEILGLFNQLAAVLVASGGRYQVYRSGEPGLEEGAVDAHLLWRVARVDLTPEEGVMLLLGAPRLSPQWTLGTAYWTRDDLFMVPVHDATGTPRERAGFDPAGVLRSLERFDVRGELVWRAGFDDHRPVFGGDGREWSFAHELNLEFPSQRARARLVVQAVELNPAIDDTLFELPRVDAGARP